MKDFTHYTLGMLLSAKDDTIRRCAIGILKQLQRNAPMKNRHDIRKRAQK